MIEATIVGGPHDGEVWAIPPGRNGINVAWPVDLAGLTTDDKGPPKEVEVRQVWIPVERTLGGKPILRWPKEPITGGTFHHLFRCSPLVEELQCR